MSVGRSMPTRAERRGAFTLIELLVVIGIIAILALIAVPNFLEAHTRARVARVRADLRTVATAMEAYAVDFGAYPFVDPRQEHTYLADIPMLTTPLAYMTALPLDAFELADRRSHRQRYYRYYPMAYWVHFYPQIQLKGWLWLAMSNGPNRRIDIDENNVQDAIDGNFWMVYDPTNGTLSFGDVWITNKGFLGSL
jgi:prepilin-type N-terminal cleavage/methylation domain-containing protein